MNARVTFCLIVFACIVAAIVIAATLPGPLVRSTLVIRYEIVNTFPHDRFAFTEGLAYSQGSLIEGAGIKGNSTLRRVNITTGEVIRERRLADEYFGEGVAVFGDRIVELTEDSHTGFIYNASTFEQVGTFIYPSEGWGVTEDGTSIIMSDGTAVLRYLDPSTFREVREVIVMDHGAPVESLNELEYVKGEIYANVWPTDRIARISPGTGEVLGWIDLTGLLSPGKKAQIGWPAIESLRGHSTIPLDKQACLNGIAYDPEGDRLFVTGKLWPALFEIRVNGSLPSHPVETVIAPAETAPQQVTSDKGNPKSGPDKMFTGDYQWAEYRNTITQTLPPNPRYSWEKTERVERSNGTFKGVPAVHYTITETSDYAEWVGQNLIHTKDGMISVTDRYFDAASNRFIGGKSTEMIKGKPNPPEDLPDYRLGPEDRPSHEMGITPFGEMNISLVITGSEPVTVPSGTYPEAGKYTGSFRDGTPVTFWIAYGVPVPVRYQFPNKYLDGEDPFQSYALIGWG